MIIPKKHIKLNESIVGISGILITMIKGVCNIDELFIALKKDKRIPKYISFDDFLIIINFLYIINLINSDNNGGIYLCD